MEKISRRSFMKAVRAAAVVGTLSAATAGTVSADACFAKKSAAGYAQTAIIKGFDWGPDVVATVIRLSSKVRSSSVRAKDFAVTEVKESFDWATFSPEHTLATAPRMVVEAYTCNSKGERTSSSSYYIRLELAYDPNVGSPFCYDVFTSKNTWCDPYQLKVQLAEDAALTTPLGRSITELEVDPSIDFSAAIISQMDGFKTNGVFTGSDGKTLTYAYYKPSTLKKVPLVIWLHGAGEGGEDPSVLLLGNKVTPLAEDAFQAAMGGAAYILTPQTPGFWLEWDENDPDSWSVNPGKPSVYTQTLKELIDQFVSRHPTIDKNRIIIGGCSNGGYMTLNMVLRYPDYFAAAYPICEAYNDAGISDAELEAAKNVPIWFVYARNDTVVDPEVYEKPTIARLQAMGAADLHTSVFDDVHDTSGKYSGEDGAPYQFMGHWSWLYFFNNECVDDVTGENMWTWLGKQSK